MRSFNVRRFAGPSRVLALVAWIALTVPAVDALGDNRFFFNDLTATIGDTDVRVPVLVENDTPRHGVSLSISYDPAVLELTGFDVSTGELGTADWTDGLIVQSDGEMVWGALMGLDIGDGEFDAEKLLPVGDELVLGELVFSVLATEPTTTQIAFEDDLPGFLSGDDAVETKNRLTAGEQSPISPDLGSATITIQEDVVEPGGFLRSDCDGNGVVELTDAINNLSYQFLGSFSPPCLDACDFNDDGATDITDPIGNLSHQFLGAAPPAAPGNETCGPDPTDDDGLSSEAYPPSSCP